VRKADIGLKSDRVIKTTLEDVCPSERVFYDGDATRLNIPLWETDAFILVAELGNKACMNVTLEKSGVHMNIASELTTFIKRVHYTFLCVGVDDFIL
jgi:hypothetical protein